MQKPEVYGLEVGTPGELLVILTQVKRQLWIQAAVLDKLGELALQHFPMMEATDPAWSAAAGCTREAYIQAKAILSRYADAFAASRES